VKQFDDLRRWFMSLEKRERRILAGGAVILLAVVIYGGILQPYVNSKAALEAHVSEQRNLLAWMGPATTRLKALGGNRPAPMAPGSLLSTVNHEASNAGLGNALRQVQQQNDGSVRVQLEGASFDTLLHWLGQLHQRYGITISEMNVQSGDSTGLVNANLSLKVPAT